MNSPSAKLTMPVIPNVSVIPSAMMPYIEPTIAPFRTWPATSESTLRRALLRVDVVDLDGAAFLEPDDIEVEDLLALVVEPQPPEPLIGHRHERALHGGGIVDRARLLHGLDEHVDMVVARRRAERRLVVREVALVEVAVRLDELLNLRILLLGLLEVLRHVDDVLVERVLVLQPWAERAAHEEELRQLAGLRRLAHDVVDVRVRIPGEEIVGLPGRDL